MTKPAQNWYVYMIYCSDHSIYTGITTNLQRRFTQHASQRGAKYFRGRKPLQILYHEQYNNRSCASKREWALKKLSRQQKLRLIGANRESFLLEKEKHAHD